MAVESSSTSTDLFFKFDRKNVTCGGLNCFVIMKYIQSRDVDNTWARTLWEPLRLQPVVGPSVFLLVTSMEGFADYKEPLWNAGCLTSFPCCCGLLLICPTADYVCYSLRWRGDWCCCCEFGLSAAVVGRYTVIPHQHARRTRTQLLFFDSESAQRSCMLRFTGTDVEPTSSTSLTFTKPSMADIRWKYSLENMLFYF